MTEISTQPDASIHPAPMDPTRLANALGAGSDTPAGPAVAALVRTLESSASSMISYEEWRQVFAEVYGPRSLQSKKVISKLADLYDVDASQPATILFAVHTYYALIVKGVTASLIDPAPILDVYRHCEAVEAPQFWAEHGITNFLDDDLFNWYLDAWSADLETALTAVYTKLRQTNPVGKPANSSSVTCDIFKPLYESLVPTAVRHDLGEYYTPGWLADLTLEELDYQGDPTHRLLDPACGSGTYVVSAINRARQWTDSPETAPIASDTLASHITENIAGFDLNPLAVLAARANYFLAIFDLLDSSASVALPVYRRDSLPRVHVGTLDLLAPPKTSPEVDVEKFDFVAGNPPWINWQYLPEESRQATKPLWKSYGLFSLSGSKGRMGGGKKDLSMLFTYVCADQYLKDGGSLGFLITQSVFKSKGAGDGFRRFRYDDGDDTTVYLRPTVVHDFTEFQPFDGATTQTALLCIEKQDRPFDYPVDYRCWTTSGSGSVSVDAGLDEARQKLAFTDRAARPVDPDHDASPWLTAPTQAMAGITCAIGESDYRAYEGVNSGGLNGCFWVHEIEHQPGGLTVIENLGDVGRIKVDKIRRQVETQRLFPLLRSGDVARWHATPKTSILLGQDPELRSGVPEAVMKRRFPKTYAYFKHFEGDPDDVQRGTLRGRSLFRRYYKPTDPFYSMYGVGTYTMSDWKVCWARIDTRIRAFVIGPSDDGRIVLPQETITFVPFDDAVEAHYFCAMFNSSPSDALVRCYSTGKGFASAHVLDTVGVPAFCKDNSAHLRLSELSKTCHLLAARDQNPELTDLEQEIDACAASVWRISTTDLTGIQDALASL